MHGAVSYAPWRIAPPWSAVQAIRAPSCCGCSPGTRRSRSCIRHRRLERGRAGRRPVSVAAPGVRRPACSRRTTSADLERPRRRVHRACRTVRRSCSSRDLLGRVRARRRPRRRLPAAAPTRTSGGTASRTPRPELLDRFAYGLVELYRDARSRVTDHVAVPGLLSDRGEPRARAARGRAPRRTARHRRQRGLGGVRRRAAALKTTSLFSEANENVVGVRLADASPHRRDGAGAVARRARGRSRCCSRRTSCRRRAASSPPATRVRPRPGLSTARLLEQYREFYADDPCVVVVDDPSGTKATYGANVVHVTVRFDVRTETVLAIAAEDNLTKGASGQAIQAANSCSACPRRPACPARSCAVSERAVSAARGPAAEAA